MMALPNLQHPKFVCNRQVVFKYILGDSSKEAEKEAAELAAQITFKVSQKMRCSGCIIIFY